MVMTARGGDIHGPGQTAGIDEAPPESRAELDNQVARAHRATNMKRTLAHSPVALAALLDEYLWPYRKGDATSGRA
jgi:hypothetical protein